MENKVQTGVEERKFALISASLHQVCVFVHVVDSLRHSFDKVNDMGFIKRKTSENPRVVREDETIFPFNSVLMVVCSIRRSSLL